jgi:hypothetical protein
MNIFINLFKNLTKQKHKLMGVFNVVLKIKNYQKNNIKKIFQIYLNLDIHHN